MSLFTLRQHGALLVDQTTGETWTCTHAMTARMHGRLTAIADNAPVEVLRAGQVAYVMLPDGTAQRPTGAEVEPRERCNRESGACFCTPCREERRASR